MFCKSGLGEDILDTDPDENIPLAELIRRTQERLGITDSITAEEYVNFDDNIEIGDDAESMVNFEENLIKEYTATTVNKEDNTDVNESDEEDGKESTQSKQNQCTIKSYGEAMDLIEQLKLFCVEKNLAFMEDVVQIEKK